MFCSMPDGLKSPGVVVLIGRCSSSSSAENGKLTITITDKINLHAFTFFLSERLIVIVCVCNHILFIAIRDMMWVA